MGTQAGVVTVTENTIMEGTHKDPKFMALVNIEVAQANTANVDRLIYNLERKL